MAILDIRDELAATKDLVGCLYLACRGLQTREERSALCAVSFAIREKLVVIDEALQDLIGTVEADWLDQGLKASDSSRL